MLIQFYVRLDRYAAVLSVLSVSRQVSKDTEKYAVIVRP